MISILVAYTKNKRIIGSKGRIPWNLPSERNRFKAICQNKQILMGRRSFEEIGHGLPYCTIIIISKTLKTAPEGCLLAHSLEEGIKIAKSSIILADSHKGDLEEILIAGGAEIYTQALAMTETKKVYATEIDADFEGDVYFPKLEGKWAMEEEATKSENNITYKYVTYFKEN